MNFHPPIKRWGCLFLFVLGFGTVSKADDPLPKPLPVSKYAKMAAHSPFAPPTAPIVQQAAPPPPPAPGWADSLTATMVMQDGNKFLVTVVDSSNSQHLYLTTEPDKTNDMAVSTVKWGTNRDDPPTITLRKGKEFAQVRYDSGAASTGGGNSIPGGGVPVIPGAPRFPTPGNPPGIPGAQPFRPPPLANNLPGNPGASAIRRPLIRAQPGAAAAPALSRPGVNAPNSGVRPNPAGTADDDDDD